MKTTGYSRWGLLIVLCFALAAAACSSNSSTSTSPGDTSPGDLLGDLSTADSSPDLATTSDAASGEDVSADLNSAIDLSGTDDLSHNIDTVEGDLGSLGDSETPPNDSEQGDVAPADTGEPDSLADVTSDAETEPDVTADASQKPNYLLEVDTQKLLISTLTGDIYKRLAIVGRIGIIRVNPTPAPHPGWKVGVIAEVRNESQGGLIFARPVRLSDTLDGDFSLLADATSNNAMVLVFKMTVRDELDQVVQQGETEPFSFSSGETDNIKTLIVRPEVTPGKIYISDPKDGKVIVQTDKEALDPYDSLMVVNLTTGVQAAYTLVAGKIDELFDATSGDVLVLFSFDSTNPDAKPSQYQQLVLP